MKSSLAAIFSVFVLCFMNACGGSSNAGGGGGGGSHMATHISVTAPATAFVGASFTVKVVAVDASNKAVTSYSGTVHFTSSDPQAVLSGDSTLTNGSGTFSASLTSLGNQTITAADTVTATITGSSNPIDIATDPSLHGFQPTGEMGTQRSAHTATLLDNGKVLITGGFNSTNVLASSEVYDPATGTFISSATMTTVRVSHTATLLAHGPAATNGKVLITGGSDNVALRGFIDSHDLATAELFDPATGTFTATGAMSERRSEHTATLLANGKVLLACGTNDNVAELFDPATGSFTSTGHLIAGGRWGCTATLLDDGTVLITGGRDLYDVFDGGGILTAELFDPAAGTFTASGVMTQFRYSHTAALLNSGKVLLTGGINGDPVQDTEIFDPTTKTFSHAALMKSPRANHTATLLDDGTVLVAGGYSVAAPALATVDVFNPVTDSFTPAGNLGTPRLLHTATRLNNGKVLITGGQSSVQTGVTVSSAELYK